MVQLGPGVRPVLVNKYPHMMPEDTIIWRRFIENGSYLPDQVWYDVRVGKAVEVPSGQPEWMHKFAEYSTRKRIDMVWRKGIDYWVVEAKPKAGVVALGQVIYYTEGFRKEYQVAGVIRPAIITDVVDEDVRPIFDAIGVIVFEVGREESLEKAQI